MNLLSIELIKTKRLGNYIMLGIMILIPIIISGIFFHLITKGKMPDSSDSLFPLDGFINKIARFVFIVFIMMNIGKEYSDKTLRRAVIDGYNRNRFFSGKIILLLVSTLIVFALLKLVVIIMGAASGHFNIVKGYLTFPAVTNQLLNLLAHGIVGLFLVFLTRSVAVSIIIYFVWDTVEGILGQLLPQIWDGWQPEYLNNFPLTVIDKIFSTSVVETQAIVMAIIYLAIMLLLPYFLFSKRDIN